MAMRRFEGKKVKGANVRVQKAGDGLSDALTLDPVELSYGDEVFLVLRGRVGRIAFEGSKTDDNELVRVHYVKTEGVAFVPDEARDQVAKILTAEADRLAELRAELEGTELLGFNPTVLEGGEDA